VTPCTALRCSVVRGTERLPGEGVFSAEARLCELESEDGCLGDAPFVSSATYVYMSVRPLSSCAAS
jgi:hypothetical protein